MYSQTIELKSLFKKEYGVIKFEIQNVIQDSDSKKLSVISFQNFEYNAVTDTRYIYLNKEELQVFASKLKEFVDKEKGVDLMFNVEGKYSLNLYPEFSSHITLMDSEGKMNIISKRNAKKLVLDIETNINLLNQ